MPDETQYVTRADLVQGLVPADAAAYLRNNVPAAITDRDTVTVYVPVEHCAGAWHPDEDAHPWRQVEIDGKRVAVPRGARIRLAALDEELMGLEREGRTREEALAIIAERHDGEVFGYVGDPI